MTKPKNLSDFTPEQINRAFIVRLRDGDPPHYLRGSDLNAWRELIATARPGDRHYIVPPLPPITMLPSMPFVRPADPTDGGLRYRTYGSAAIVESAAERDRRTATSTRRLRDVFLIELDTLRASTDEIAKPIDDPADRFSQIELDDGRTP